MKYLLVGDLHGNHQWLTTHVFPAATTIGADVVVALGDLGFWPAGLMERDPFLAAAAVGPVPLWWLEGNREHHRHLHTHLAAARTNAGITDETQMVPLFGRLHYLPRGCRWHDDAGVSFAVMGGARSIDRRLRKIDSGWFEAELITDEDLDRLGRAHADVLLCHDAPSGYSIPGLLRGDDLPWSWRMERPACEEHRLQVRRAVEAVKPELVVHGHYHVAYSRTPTEPWEPMKVVGLDRDGGTGNLAVLTTAEGVPVLKTVPGSSDPRPAKEPRRGDRPWQDGAPIR